MSELPNTRPVSTVSHTPKAAGGQSTTGVVVTASSTQASAPKSQSASQAITADTSNVQQSQKPTIANNTQLAIKATQAQQLQAIVQRLQGQQQLHAEVKSIQPLNKQNQLLLAKLNPEVAAQILSKPTTQNTLYMVKLVDPSTGHKILTTITPNTFKKGDMLLLQMNHNKDIVIKPSISNIRTAMTEGLRQSLPLQQNTSRLLNVIHLLEKLPVNLQADLASPKIQQALKQLSTFIHSNQTLSTGPQLKTALNTSGIFTEQKVHSQQSLSHDLRTILGKLSQALNNESPHNSANTLLSSTKQLSTLENALVQFLSNIPLVTSTHGKSSTPPEQITHILQLLGIKVSENTNHSTKKLKEVIHKQLAQLIQSSQEKIHFNQLRSLNSEAENVLTKGLTINTEIALRWGDQVLPLQLSIKEIHEENNGRRFNYDDDNENENDNESDENHHLTRRWQVFMSFDLPGKDTKNIEQLHTQLTVIQDTVSVTLWTESHWLCQTAKNRLASLRNNLIAKGLNVEDLTCIEGKPPKQSLSLDYNLVDVTT